MLSLFLGFLLLLSGAQGAPASPSAHNLLAGKKPSAAKGVKRARILTDNERAAEGDAWKTKLTAVFGSPRDYVEYDLERSTTIDAVYLQGDNNDRYAVSVSDDGKSFRPLFVAAAVSAPGLRSRSEAGLGAVGRYVRVSPDGGDGSYALAELQLFSVVPSAFPPSVPTASETDPSELLMHELLKFTLAVGLALFLTRRGAPWPLTAAVCLLPIAEGVLLLRALDIAWPPAGREVALVRAAAAAIAGMALVREVVGRSGFPAERRLSLAALALAGIMAALGFYNLGHFQFWNHRHHRPEFVHTFDMRVYHPVAKYFRELRFDGVYLASVAAYIDDQPKVTLASVRQTPLRDLRTHEMRRVAEVESEIAAVRARFSSERWREFKEDMRYFRETMGPRDYLGSLTDHGANATPVWLAVAHAVFASLPANGVVLTLGALLDPLLLSTLFVAIWRTFGARAMWLSLVVFGANDFYMFGSNWAGSTLRHDWMAHLGFGLCALKVRRFTLAGFFFGLAAMIRAFPAVALVGVCLWLSGRALDHRRRYKRFPAPFAFLREERAALRVLAGALVTAVALFLISGLVLSFSAWSEWLEKLMLLEKDPHVNHVSLRALIAGSGHSQARHLLARWPLFATGILLCVGAIVQASRGRRLDEAALLSLPLIAVVFSPANYYIHFIFLLPLLGRDALDSEPSALGPRPLSRRALSHLATAGPLLAICIGQYWVSLDPDVERHFQYATGLLFVAFIALYSAALQASAASVCCPEPLG